MFPRVVQSAKIGLLLAWTLLACDLASAQNHGGGRVSIPATNLGRPDGVDEKDALKDFHQALAVQATSQQIAEFQQAVTTSNGARDMLTSFLHESGKGAREGLAALDAAIEAARTANRKFQQGFSDAQKSGLKDITRKVEKADSDLGQEVSRFDLAAHAEVTPAELATQAESLNKVLASFCDEQLALGREMGITLSSGQDLVFNLPSNKIPVNLGGAAIVIGASGELSQSESKADARIFQLDLLLDLSDLQHSISEIMSSQLDGGRLCGDRLAIRRATIAAAAPASSLILDLRYERWVCRGTSGSSPMELAQSDGSVEMKLTPTVDNSNSLGLACEVKRIVGSDLMAEDFRGDLGEEVRNKVAQSILSALRAGADFKADLPGAAQGATLQSAKFQDAAGVLKASLQGRVEMSNEQVNRLADQLNQKLSAQSAQPSQEQSTPH